MVSWSEAMLVGTLERQLSGAPARIDLVRVKGAVFWFRKNWEIEEADVSDRTDLPINLNSWSLKFTNTEKAFE